MVRKASLICLLLTGSLFLSNTSSSPYRDVYICKGPQSKKYHLTPSCRGLTRCSTSTFKVSIEEARGIGRTLCGWED